MNSDIDKILSKGRVERWQLLAELPQIEGFIGLQQDEANLTIFLRPLGLENRRLKIHFDNALCYRSAREGLFFNSVELIDRALWGSTFFIVSDSEFLRQFHEYSSHAFEDWNIIHYAIFADFIVDILSIEEPSVSWEEQLPIKERI